MKRLSQCIILSKSKAVVFPSEASCYFYSARDYYSQDYCLVKGELEVSRVVVLHRAAVSRDSHKKPVSFYLRTRQVFIAISFKSDDQRNTFPLNGGD